ncbi:hypothetical protein P148_SR1C00001G0881 [candidate division SR1 bacterium RAAC1_SR1_1]|nr:hypothetical protein P148_SR1C00001G0881 [candidate division SR1 bacterium RAAC1_SR1_1]
MFFQSVIKITVFILVLGGVIGLIMGKITGEQYLGLITAFMTGYFSGRIPNLEKKSDSTILSPSQPKEG